LRTEEGAAQQVEAGTPTSGEVASPGSRRGAEGPSNIDGAHTVIWYCKINILFNKVLKKKKLRIRIIHVSTTLFAWKFKTEILSNPDR
jgi:hypothetical protein